VSLFVHNLAFSTISIVVQLGKQYPYVPPKLTFRDVFGLKPTEEAELIASLRNQAKKLALLGSVMILELVQLAEAYLVEHNQNPLLKNVSAWDIQKAREEQKTKEQNKAILFNHEKETSYENLNESQRPRRGSEEYSSTIDGMVEVEDSDFKKELERELNAYDVAKSNLRQKRLGHGATAEPVADTRNVLRDLDDEDDDVNDLDFDEPPPTSSSRYDSDFHELGILGRGGGGEVMKCRNRLDRRVYAVKKILLEREKGKHSSGAAERNQKLRREVTTISRMMHKNIVRYYQAWLEGAKNDNDEAIVNGTPTTDDINTIESKSYDGLSKAIETNEVDSGSGIGLWATRQRSIDGSSMYSAEMLWDEIENSRSDSESDSSSQIDSNPLDEEEMKELGLTHNPLMFGFGKKSQEKVKPNEPRNLANGPEIRSQQSSSDLESASLSDQKIKHDGTERILYIQMEYCSTTLRRQIDEGILRESGAQEIWRMARQMLAGLVYIHSRSVIHRDLKPSNVFIDSERNIRIGDFGLATMHRMSSSNKNLSENEVLTTSLEMAKLEDLSEDMYRGLRDEDESSTKTPRTDLKSFESMTGGVGTTFYRAPEQEGHQKGENSYGVKVDIYSFGIILFEMFHPPFGTAMERAETLSTLRQDFGIRNHKISKHWSANLIDIDEKWSGEALKRFPKTFRDCVPDSAQKLILLCIQHDPSKRPSAEEILTSGLLPRKLEVEARYFNEVLQIVANPESNGYEKLLAALFKQPTGNYVDVMYDTDASINLMNIQQKSTSKSILESFISALNGVGGSSSANTELVRKSAMNLMAMAAATVTLKRARGVEKISKSLKAGKEGEVLRGVPRLAASALAFNAGMSAAITGHSEGVHGADPNVIQYICDKLTSIFVAHGAVLLKPPLLRPNPPHPRTSQSSHTTPESGNQALVMNQRGILLLLPYDLTAGFARSVARGGDVCSRMKRYDIDRVYRGALSGGHPKECLEASFDIVYGDMYASSEYIEAEALVVVCNVMSTILLPSASMSNNFWFLRLTNTRLSDSILDFCGVPQQDDLRDFCFRILGKGACSAEDFASERPKGKKGRAKHRKMKGGGADAIDEDFKLGVDQYGLPEDASHRLRTFLCPGCFPLSSDIGRALNSIEEATRKLRIRDVHNGETGSKRSKRYEDIGKGISSLRKLIDAMIALGIGPTTNKNAYCEGFVPPSFISLDLSIRQKRKHFHGALFFEASIVSLMHTENNHPGRKADSRAVSVKTLVVAEGGRYDDLVRRNRPPGNFGSIQINHYTASPIPICMGVIFFIGKIVERLYNDSSNSRREALAGHLDGAQVNVKHSFSSVIETIRLGLAHPFPNAKFVQCIVVSTNGFDSASIKERAIVASKLWRAGIPTEFLPQGSVFLNVLEQPSQESDKLGALASVSLLIVSNKSLFLDSWSYVLLLQCART